MTQADRLAQSARHATLTGLERLAAGLPAAYSDPDRFGKTVDQIMQDAYDAGYRSGYEDGSDDVNDAAS